MGSLTAHLREPGDHGRLPFHPDCPVCRQERLYGTLSSEPVLSRRAQALLAGSVLAFSSSAPAVAVAQEPDRQFEGVAAPEEPGGAELDDPSFDPGGDTALTFETAPAPAAPDDGVDSGDGAPLDVEPTVDVDAQLAPLAEMDAPAYEEDSGVPPAEAVPPAGSEVPTSAPPSGAVAPGSGVPPAPPATPGITSDRNSTTPPSPQGERAALSFGRTASSHQLDASAPSRYTDKDVREDAGAPASSQRVSDGAGVPSDVRVAPSPQPPAAPAGGASAAGTISVSASTSPTDPSIDRDSRFYVVQPGDSLWSIAKRLLGRDASAGLIAREVNRLWSLNGSRIATGDPDLLMVGTRLELR